jgi:hypothetical protein
LIADWTSGVVTSLALTTTVAGTLPPGNAASMRSSVFRIGVPLRDMPSVPGSLNCMCSAGSDIATSTPPARIADRAGCLRTRLRMAFHVRDSPLFLWRRLAT